MKYLFFLFLLPTICQAQEAQTYNYEGELALDVYNAGGSADRTLLLFVHGGGFSGGSRDSEDVVQFCRNIANQNFVVVSISYELKMKGRGFGCDIPAHEKINVFRDAALDVARATRFLLDKRDDIGFNRIVLAGSSAGAETVLHLAFWKEAQQGLNRNTYSGVISFAGALVDLDLIQKDNAIPAMLIHGTCDNLVPYGSAPHHYCDYPDPGYLQLHGAGAIASQYQELGKSYALYTVCGGNHDWASIPMRDMTVEIGEFIRSYVENGTTGQVHEWIVTDASCDYPSASVCEN